MKRYTALFAFLLLSSYGFGQSNWKAFTKLSGPKKNWVIWHVFKAKKARQISLEARRVADSIKNSPLLDRDPSGGQVDAFRHAYWMARLRQEIGKNAARSLGKAHEKENYNDFLKRRKEEGSVPDAISSEMDLYNNEIGLSFTVKNCVCPREGLIYKIINAIKAGKLKVIKKNKDQQFLTCNDAVIPEETLQGAWYNKKCLVPSNYRNR